MQKLLAAALILFAGCGQNRFVNVGGNTGLPENEIARYAREHRVTYDEAAVEIGQQVPADSQELKANSEPTKGENEPSKSDPQSAAAPAAPASDAKRAP